MPLSSLRPLCLLALLPLAAACSDYTLQGPDDDTGEPVVDTGDPSDTDDTGPWTGPPYAVLTGEYDSVERIADSLGLDYDLLEGTGWDQIHLLSNPEELEKYDAILFNCGMGEGWMSREQEVAANLRDYVHGGGSIYVSDWSYWMVEGTFTWSGDGQSGSHEGPLVVRASYGQGTVIFTTFHDTAQTSDQVHTLLEQIILSL